MLQSRLVWLVFAGGAIGSLARALATSHGSDLGQVLIMNVFGAAVLGLIQHSYRYDSPAKQALWATGFCGGFTTLSGVVLIAVLANLDPLTSIGYVALTAVLSVGGYALAAYLGKSYGGPQ
jgi:fluoride ion exporter CrcB/FEX